MDTALAKGVTFEKNRSTTKSKTTLQKKNVFQSLLGELMTVKKMVDVNAKTRRHREQVKSIKVLFV